MNYVPQADELTEAKKEHIWLEAAPSHILQRPLRDLERACKDRGTFRVRWRLEAGWSPSFRFPTRGLITVEHLGRKWGRVRLLELDWVTFRHSRLLRGTIRCATVSHEDGWWFVSFLVDDRAVTPGKHAMPDTVVGIDRGVVVVVTTSDGDFHDRRRVTEGEKKRYRRLQQCLSRQGRAARTGARLWS